MAEVGGESEVQRFRSVGESWRPRSMVNDKFNYLMKESKDTALKIKEETAEEKRKNYLEGSESSSDDGRSAFASELEGSNGSEDWMAETEGEKEIEEDMAAKEGSVRKGKQKVGV